MPRWAQPMPSALFECSCSQMFGLPYELLFLTTIRTKCKVKLVHHGLHSLCHSSSTMFITLGSTLQFICLFFFFPILSNIKHFSSWIFFHIRNRLAITKFFQVSYGSIPIFYSQSQEFIDCFGVCHIING